MQKAILAVAVSASLLVLGGCATRAETVGTGIGMATGAAVGGGTLGAIGGGMVGYGAGHKYDQKHNGG